MIKICKILKFKWNNNSKIKFKIYKINSNMYKNN